MRNKSNAKLKYRNVRLSNITKNVDLFKQSNDDYEN